MKKKIMAALLAGVMMLQQPVSGWCAQNTELTQKSEARQESERSEDTADGSEDDTEATGTAAADDGENSQKEDSEDVPTLQAETDEVTLDTGTSDNAPEGQRKILDHIYAESVDLSGMTQDEAQEALQTRVDEITGYQIVLHMDDMSTGVTAKELGVTGDNDDTIRQAMDVGQVGNVIKRYKVKKALEQENLQLDGHAVFSIVFSFPFSLTLRLLLLTAPCTGKHTSAHLSSVFPRQATGNYFCIMSTNDSFTIFASYVSTSLLR